MVVWTYDNYTAANYGISAGIVVVTFIALALLPKDAYLFVVDRILGIHKCVPKESGRKNNPARTTPVPDADKVEKEEVDIYDEVVDLRRHKVWRFFIWTLTSVTVALLFIIIFQTLFLSTQRVTAGKQCPDFIADCFVFQTQTDVEPRGPYNCTPGDLASFPVDGSIWCFGWVFYHQDMGDLLEVLGTCGGLLGIIGSVVPFVYYMSANEKCFPCSISYGFFVAVLMVGIAVLLWYFKVSISLMTWVVLILTGSQSVLASVWAFVTVRKKQSVEREHGNMHRDERPPSSAIAMNRARMRRVQPVTTASSGDRRQITSNRITTITS